MGYYIQRILDWSEVWALFIPLTVWFFNRQQPSYLKPVIFYLWIALALNLSGNFIADFKQYLPAWLQGNNPLYNLHSLVRFTCFCTFFLNLRQPYFQMVRKWIPNVSLVFFLINFIFFEDFFYYYHLSGNLLSAEAYLLLVYCMLYYLSQLKQDVASINRGPDFWVTTGLCIYVVINFFVFLFYVPLIKQNAVIADQIWTVHNIAYILLSIFIATAFYVSPRAQYRI